VVHNGRRGSPRDRLGAVAGARRSRQIAAVADALQIAISELTRLPVPAPANGHTDSTIEAIRRTLDAIEVGHPGGVALPLIVLRSRSNSLRPSCGHPISPRWPPYCPA
jgi:hypothetical protein